MKEFSEKKVKFVIRAKENRKHEEIKSLIETNQDLDIGDNLLIKDSIVKLYTGVPVENKKGNVHYRQEKVEHHFRLVVVQNKKKPKKFFIFSLMILNLQLKKLLTIIGEDGISRCFLDSLNKN